jgi:hypothetical protein
MAVAEKWVPIEMEVNVRNRIANTTQLVKIEGLHNIETDTKVVSLQDVCKKEFEIIAKELGLEPRIVSDLILIGAPARNIKPNLIKNKFTFNKMVFYVQKIFEQKGFEDSIILDECHAGRAGPIPIHLSEDIETLKSKDLLKYFIVKDGKKEPMLGKMLIQVRDVNGAKQVELTRSGQETFKKAWNAMDNSVKAIFLGIKERLCLMTPEDLKIKVHKEYPEYKKNYTELDSEEFSS